MFQPSPRFHVGSAERWSNDAAAVRTDRTQRVQVGKETIWIDARHEPILEFLSADDTKCKCSGQPVPRKRKLRLSRLPAGAVFVALRVMVPVDAR